jgi:hypothetical protein
MDETVSQGLLKKLRPVGRPLCPSPGPGQLRQFEVIHRAP